MFYYDILCLIIVLTLIGLILYQTYYNKDTSTNINEPESKTNHETFLVLNDTSLYSSKNEVNKPITIKTQIPVPANQLSGNELQQIDSSILRHSRILKTFSMIDELDFYQMYNILKQLKNKKYKFTYNIDNISSTSSIINTNKLNTINSGAINNVDLNLFTRIKLELISSFNNFIINSGEYVPYHPYQFFKIINSNLISFDKKYKIDSNDNDIDKYCFTLTFAREYKFQQFVIYYDIDLINNITTNPITTNPITTNPITTNPITTNPITTNPITTNPITTNPITTNPQISQTSYKTQNYIMILNKIEIIGLPDPNTIEFNKNNKIKTDDVSNTREEQFNTQNEINDYYNNDFYYKDQVIENNASNFIPGDENSKFFQKKNMKLIDNNERSDIDLTLLDKDSVSSKINEKIMNIAKDTEFNNHRCFGFVNGISQELPQYKNPIFCKSYHPEINQNGIWDSPCQVDNDCPFYKANKNYTNEFGKCDKETGSCEMPLGIIPIGFTKYGKLEPNCYNCDITSKDSKCCRTQINDIKEGSVNYKSPDYIFSNDESSRKKFKDELELIGLKANPSI